MENRVISNATPIIGVSIIDQFHLLSDLFEKVYVPEAVYREVVLSESISVHGKAELKAMIVEKKFHLLKVENSNLVNKLYGKLHEGELEVIVGAKEHDIKIVVIDEKSARELAKTFLLRPIGTVGVLIFAKEKGLINEVKVFLDTLMDYNFNISKKVYQNALTLAGEKL
ncbi:DUF3368 domain-containing protein [Pseudogracilibacillus sp. SO30301A]|uniref:DUF3368 domain-containing protein n=1 Tax=Pseudogracilibacillus sp. SO30301A TaxID=3098291 RepID=UPI00300E6B7D